ncbi:MAG: winged helix-turn-helix domain-containing protein, partial [Oscillospiraceae bacterium]|nr:winged helix-turn-helix domain-containing protein [Oscillospiraceae bacterium]
MMMNRSYEKQNLLTRYFPLPNSIFDLDLHPTAIAIYAYLLHIEDRETYECRVSYRTISEKLHMAINTVAKYVSELEESGLIRTEHTTHEMEDGSRRNGSLRYHILKIDGAE